MFEELRHTGITGATATKNKPISAPHQSWQTKHPTAFGRALEIPPHPPFNATQEGENSFTQCAWQQAAKELANPSGSIN
jgi:hypothetical protein